MHTPTPTPWLNESGTSTVYALAENGQNRMSFLVDYYTRQGGTAEEALANAALIVRAVNERQGLESEVSRLKSLLSRLEEAYAAEVADHHKTIDAAEKAAEFIEQQNNAIHVATAEIDKLQAALKAAESL